MITGSVALFFHFPSSDFCLHNEHQLVIIVCFFLFILNTGSKICVIKTRCDYHSCHRLALCGSKNHQQFHFSHSTVHGYYLRKQISKILRGQRSTKKAVLIVILQSVCVWCSIGRIPLKIWIQCAWLTSPLITEQPVMLGFGSSASPLRIYCDHGNKKFNPPVKKKKNRFFF